MNPRSDGHTPDSHPRPARRAGPRDSTLPRTGWPCLLGLIAFLFSGPLLAADIGPGEQFEAGKLSFSAGHYQAALAQFEAARDGGLEGPAVHYNIGVSAYRLGRYEAARNAFLEVARVPDMAALAYYNLGLVSLREGETAAAARWFRQVGLASQDEKLLGLADVQLSRLEAAEPPSRWLGYLHAGVGYDDNVALVADDSTLAVSGSDSGYLEGQLAVAGLPVPWLRLDASVFGLDYWDRDEFDQLLGRVGAAYLGNAGSWDIEFGLRLDHSTLDGESFESRTGLGLLGTRDLGNAWLRLSYRFEDISGHSGFGGLDGTRQQFSTILGWAGEPGRLTLEGGVEINDRKDGSVGPERKLVVARLERPLIGKLDLAVSAGYRWSQYNLDQSADRDEDRVVLAGELTRELGRGWEIRGRFDYTDNDSSDREFDYTRNRLLLSLSRIF